MKKVFPILLFLIIIISLGIISYTYIIPRFILSMLFIFGYIATSIRFLKPSELRRSKLKFITIPTITLILAFIFITNPTLYITSLISAYIIASGSKKWFKSMYI